jgi:anaerobic magnesium-protoporphyrin IX monomethyl ester cyclase
MDAPQRQVNKDTDPLSPIDMKFIFINPCIKLKKRNIWSIVSSVTPPLGLATLAAILEQEGVKTAIIDAFAMKYTLDDIILQVESAIEEHEEHFIGLTAMTPEINDAIDIAHALSARFPKAHLILGGVHASIFHRSLVDEKVCDMVVRKEGERAIADIARGKPLESIPGLTWRAPGGEVIENPESGDYVDLESLPFPAYHKLPMGRYHAALGVAKRSPSIGMITSRGCPGKCTFCYSAMFGSKIRFVSAPRVLEHIRHLVTAYGIREISFYDDTFTANRKRVEELCTLIVSQKIDISWSCFARVDSVNAEILRTMKDAGCHHIMYGFETVDENILRAINKRVTTEKYGDVIAWTRKAGIDIRGAFMMGNPEETEESLRKTLEYSKKIGIQFAIYNITTPFPGTALFEWAQEKGYISHMDWRLYDLAHAILKLPTITPEKVEEFYRRAYKEFYLRPSFIARRLMALSNPDEFAMLWKTFLRLLAMVLSGREEK